MQFWVGHSEGMQTQRYREMQSVDLSFAEIQHLWNWQIERLAVKLTVEQPPELA